MIIIITACHCYYPIDDGSISLIVILVELERREEAARRHHLLLGVLLCMRMEYDLVILTRGIFSPLSELSYLQTLGANSGWRNNLLSSGKRR